MADELDESGSLPSFGSRDPIWGAESTAGAESVVPSPSRFSLHTAAVGGFGANNNQSNPVDFSHAIGAAWNSLDSCGVEPVWNSGFWKCIFGNETLGSNLKQQFKRPTPVGFDSGDVESDHCITKKGRLRGSVVSAEPFFRSCVKSTDDVTWQEQRDDHLQKSLKHWLVLVESWAEDVEFVKCISGCDSVNSKLIMLGDVFRGKAPSTLSKRANSMRILCEQLGSKYLTFPCSESDLYGVLCKLRGDGAPPSRGKGILEAIAFVRHTMGVVECDPLLKGRRCWGACTADEPVNKSQASPLTVKELEILHSTLQSGDELWDRMFCGTVLFVTYARARWSDAQHSTRLIFDTDDQGEIHFVEALTGTHKTLRALQHRHQFLPLVAPAVGINQDNWAKAWMKCRSDLGVDIDLGHAMMPAPLEDGSPGKRALDSQEAGRWLRSLLKLEDSDVAVRKVSSHSLKATMLSFLAKRGVDISDRLLLGYHSSPFTMGLTYSRDAMARPMQVLNNMLSEIRRGLYFPDCTRSGRLVSQTVAAQGLGGSSNERNAVIKIEIEDDEVDSHEWQFVDSAPDKASVLEELQLLPESIPETCENDVNDACTETSSSETSEPEELPSGFSKSGRKTFEPPVAPDGFTMWQHKKSKILHLVDDSFPSSFVCGRRPGSYHTCEFVETRWDSSICWKCFKNT